MADAAKAAQGANAVADHVRPQTARSDTSSSGSSSSDEDGPTYAPVKGKAESDAASSGNGNANANGSGSGNMRRIATAGTANTAATVATAPDDLAPDSPGDADDDDDDDDDQDGPKQSFLERIGLDAGTLMMMLKGSIAPTIGVAIYQSNSFAHTYTTLGYLVPIISVLNVVIMPRGKFIQTLLLNLLSVSAGAALALLILYSGTQARAHTSGPLTAADLAQIKATGHVPYNSSQSAVCAVWLTFSIWIINLLRAKLPTFTLPSIAFSILINIACTFGPLMLSMTQAKALVRQIYTAMLTAMALSTGVSLLFIPISSRTILMGQAKGVIGLMRRAVSLQGEYLRGLERGDMYALETIETAVGDLGPATEFERHRQKLRSRFQKTRKAKGAGKGDGGKPDAAAPPRLTKEEKAAQALRATITALRELTGKMEQEVRFAKRDAAFGKLTAHDLGEIVKLLRAIFVPVTGMSTIMDIFRRTAENHGWKEKSNSEDDESVARERERRVWNEIMKQLHEPFVLLSEAIDQGLEHAGLQLGLLPKTKEQKAKDKEARKARKAQKACQAQAGGGVAAEGKPEATGSTPSDDVEASAGQIKPGEHGFASVVNEKVQKFYQTRSEILRVWARERGLMEEAMPMPAPKDGSTLDPMFATPYQRQSQLYVLLYMEQLMIATGEAVQDFVDFADKKVADGTMDKTRFLYPTVRRLRKWLVSVFDDKDAANEEAEDVLKPNFNVVFVGDGFNAKKDPEHLPATNAWQHFGNGLRVVSRFLGSDESVFGLRVACATMTVAIICYLRATQVFFQEQRLVWAMIIIAMGMSQTSGQSIFGFFCRIGGSALAMVFSYIIWYIVDGKTAGVIVFLWFFIFCEYYFFIKFPRFVAVSMITIITQVLIIGYELQVRKIGIAAAEASGQKAYPTYLLAPYRLLTVSGGSAVAFFWTIFPKPVTDRTWLRRDLSATLYILANYFSVINETLKSTMHGTGGNMDVPGTPAHRLFKVRRKLFSKLMLLLPSLQMHSDWQKWEPTIGGQFPRATYEDIILRAGRILNYLTLVSYTVTWKPRHSPGLIDDTWLKALSALMTSMGPTHYTILSTLALLSNSLLSGQSLPPYIPLPRPYELTRQLLALKSKSQAKAAAAAKGSAKGSAGGGTGLTRAVTTTDTTGGDDFKKQPMRRRNSLWGKQSWRPEKGSMDTSYGGGLYERKDGTEDDRVPDLMRRPLRRASTVAERDEDQANWRDMAEVGVSTTTGATMLSRIPTGTAAQLVDARNIEELGYTEFAVLQVCSTLVCDDLEGMIQAVSGLVGVVDFSFRMDTSDVDLDEGEKGKGKKD